GAAREGLHAMVADPAGTLFAAWLDLRAKGTRLYGAQSADGGLTWSKNIEIYASPGGTICQCCHPALAYGKDGRLWVMWRNVIDSSRDFYATSSRDGVHFDAARKLGEGTWKLNACPMDGGAIAAANGAPVSAWRREGLVYLAEAGHPEKQIGTGKDVAMVETAGGAYVAWTKGAALEFLRPGAAAAEPLAATGAFVSLIALPGGSVLAAWEAGPLIETKRLN
ncbi:MAG: sialidase family protein, partial [Acidobacteria bacterium]|nr:sialidase family protein [Acidobacteriota bacterium]